MAEDLVYDGTTLTWITNGRKSYKASSGYFTRINESTHLQEEARMAKFQSDAGTGPIPEGTYHIPISISGTAPVINKYTSPPNDFSCDLASSKEGGIEQIPEHGQGNCREYTYPGWGYQRIRIFKDKISQPTRDNFYFHDSRKGYSHGCVETEKSFFDDIKAMRIAKRGNYILTLRVKYPSPESSTYGETDK